MASIRQRNDKWQARVRRKGLPAIEKTFLTRLEAEKWARLVESEVERGLFIDRTEAERTLFADILLRYKNGVTPQKRGMTAEAIRIDTLIKSTLGQYSMVALTSAVIARWRDSRLKKVSGSTVNRELNIISAVINVAMREWNIALPQNPVTAIKRPPSNQGRDRRLEPDEERLLLNELTITPRNLDGTFSGMQNTWLKPLVQFALETAMRRGELLSLTWDDIDLTRQIARLSMTKNGTSRACQDFCVKRGHEIIPKGMFHDRRNDHQEA
ncbi:tyrosine-type recombinase/integrase [Noviherbaspirillum malthae]|uniref:tyrosine-type recombinase/integrase n=1 Tax=Noviherbaspirillum malthae TaxID=1260987 RepID=UPI00188E9296|nr:tyrosine-type recombinase/integrase [Noviherbaspirillum malthae]